MNNKFLLLLSLSLPLSSARPAGYSMKQIETAQKAAGVVSLTTIPLAIMTDQKNDGLKQVFVHVSQCLSRATESDVLLQKLANIGFSASTSSMAGYNVIKKALQAKENALFRLRSQKDAVPNLRSREELEEALANAREQIHLWRRPQIQPDHQRVQQREIAGWMRTEQDLLWDLQNHDFLVNYDKRTNECDEHYKEEKNAALLAAATAISAAIFQEIADTVCVKMVGRFKNRAIRRVLRSAILAVNATAIPEIMKLIYQGHYFAPARDGSVSVENSDSFRCLKNRPGQYLIELAKSFAKNAALQATYEIVGELIARSANDAGTLEWLSKEKAELAAKLSTGSTASTTLNSK